MAGEALRPPPPGIRARRARKREQDCMVDGRNDSPYNGYGPHHGRLDILAPPKQAPLVRRRRRPVFHRGGRLLRHRDSYSDSSGTPAPVPLGGLREA